MEDDTKLQAGQEAPKLRAEGEGTPKEKPKVMRTEIPDSEASELLSPIKVGASAGASGGGNSQADGGLEDGSERAEYDVEENDSRMIDVALPLQDDGNAGEEGSRVEERTEQVKPKISEGAEGGSMEDTEGMDYIMEKDYGSCLTADGAGSVAEEKFPKKKDVPSTDTSLGADEFKESTQNKSASETNDAIIQASPDKGDGMLLSTPAPADKQKPLSSPAIDPREIAIAAGKLTGKCSHLVACIGAIG